MHIHWYLYDCRGNFEGFPLGATHCIDGVKFASVCKSLLVHWIDILSGPMCIVKLRAKLGMVSVRIMLFVSGTCTLVSYLAYSVLCEGK